MTTHEEELIERLAEGMEISGHAEDLGQVLRDCGLRLVEKPPEGGKEVEIAIAAGRESVEVIWVYDANDQADEINKNLGDGMWGGVTHRCIARVMVPPVPPAPEVEGETQ